MNAGFDPLRLYEWQIPDTTQVITRRDVAFYALSVGLGHNPLDPSVLRHVDPWSPDLRPLPSMVLVMGYPGFWLGDPALGLDPRGILHAGQSIEILAPIPVEGTVTGRTRVTGLVDRGEGRGALLHSERAVFDGHGRQFARLHQTHVLRNLSGFEPLGTVPPAPRRPMALAPVVAEILVPTRPEQALLYRLNGDANPLHCDPEIAAGAGFSAPILHGMCSFALMARAVVDGLCAGRFELLTGLSMRFTGVVYPGETLRAEICADGTFRATVQERGDVVIDHGQAVVRDATGKERAHSHAL